MVVVVLCCVVNSLLLSQSLQGVVSAKNNYGLLVYLGNSGNQLKYVINWLTTPNIHT